MSNLPNYNFQSPEEFEKYLASQQSDLEANSPSSYARRGRSPMENLGGVLTKLLSIVIICFAVPLFYNGSASSEPATREDRISMLSWAGWLCGREFDPDSCIFTKKVEMPELPKTDFPANTQFIDHLEQDQRRRSESMTKALQQIHGN